MVGISDREVGRLEQDIENLKHRARNDRTIIMHLSEEVDSLRLEIAALRIRLYTALTVAAVFVSAFVWVLEFLFPGD